jgi:hypothetical protein
MIGLVVQLQKQRAQILFWVAIGFSTGSANKKTWTPSYAG